MLPTSATHPTRRARFFDNGPLLVGENAWIAAVLVAVTALCATITAAALAAEAGARYDTDCVPFLGSQVCQAPTAPVWWVATIFAIATVFLIASFLCLIPRLVLRMAMVERYYVEKIACAIIRDRFWHVWLVALTFVAAAVVTYLSV